MKVGAGIGGALEKVPRDAQRVEALGYDFAICGELRHDSILTMCVAGCHSQRLELQTAVTIAFPRAPMVLAMEAWDLQRFTGGRFALGLGSQVKGHNERRFGGSWAPPAPRMKEYIETLHAIWDTFQDGAAPAYEGKHYRFSLMTPNFNPGPNEVPRPRVFLAAVGEAMARVAGEVADGVIPHGFTTDRYMRQVLLPNVRIGLERSGRSFEDIEITGGGFLVLGEDEAELETKLEGMRRQIAFYGSTRSYHDVFEIHGWRDLGLRLHELSRRGAWDEMTKSVPDEVLREFVDTATYDELPALLAEKREYVRRIVVDLPLHDEQRAGRLREIVAALRRVETPGVPRESAAAVGARAGG